MEYTWVSLLWSSLFLAASLILRSRFRSKTHLRPPGPPGWPVVGNIFDLGAVPHRTLYELRFRYGPVLWLKLGSVNTMAVQSSKAAAELFKSHDLAFCDRTCPHVFTAQGYSDGSLAVGQYGPYWRAVRRLCTAELLVGKRVSDSGPERRACVDDMLRLVAEESARGEAGEVDVPRFLFLAAFSLVGRLMLSRDLAGGSREREFYDAMCVIMELAGTPNVADFLPWTRRWDPQGLKGKMEAAMGTAVGIIGGYVKERIDDESVRGTESVKRDFLEALLEYKRDRKDGSSPEISDHNVVIIVLELFFGGSETTSSTLEWAMTELLRHPEIMKKAQQELDDLIAPTQKPEESHIDQLPYLQAIVKEVLRLHPPLPLLLPRNTVEDTKYMGYTIPKNTQVFVNAWAIGRDPDAWEDPLSFKPERFLGSSLEYKGQNYEFIPFGSGRRICVGMALGHKMVHLTLASLIYCFEWELGGGLTPETMDMSERLGLTVRKLVPLKAIPKKRSV